MKCSLLARVLPIAAVALVASVLTGPPASSTPLEGTAKPTLAGSPAAAAAKPCVPAPGANCSGANLRGVNLQGRHLKGINLRRANLQGANLRGTDLRGADLRGAVLVGADLRGTKLKGADLRAADFTRANLHNAGLDGATLNDGDLDAFVLPDEGQKVIDLLGTATQSIDIVIYEIGGPLVVGEPGAPGALMKAVSAGVKVRIVVNGNWPSHSCSFDDTRQVFTDQFTCAQNAASWIYAVQNSLQYAYAHPNPGVTPIQPEVNFANNNFQITHQKTILLDATYPSGANAGQPRPASDMLATSLALISTGNLLSLYWGSNYNQTGTTWMTDPASTCAPPNPPYQGPAGSTTCQVESGARDFAIPVTDAASIASISSVFFSDFNCGAIPPSTTPSRSNTNGLLTTTLPLAWSNGSLQGPKSTTPTTYPTVTYGYSRYGSTSQQGNVRQLQLALINNAKSSLLVYNEEMSDPQVIAALAAAAQRLGKSNVRIVMTYGWDRYDDTINYYPEFAGLAAAGASIVLTQYGGAAAQSELYIHAKAIVADGTNAWVGSTNIGQASMDYNRELGIMMTSMANPQPNYVQRVAALSSIVTTFNQDFADSKNGTPWAQIAAKPISALRAGAAPSGRTASERSWTQTFPVLCGALPTSDGPVPAPDW
ncbi:MAG: pentapeptide repeat-containing protein [Actinomycetota bacterium]